MSYILVPSISKIRVSLLEKICNKLEQNDFSLVAK